MKKPVLESLSNNAAGLQACNFIKKRLLHRCFPVKYMEFLRTPIFKTSVIHCFCNVPFWFALQNQLSGVYISWTVILNGLTPSPQSLWKAKVKYRNQSTFFVLAHFRPMFLFYNPLKHQKTIGFMLFAGGIWWENWPGMREATLKTSKNVTKTFCEVRNDWA